jgi:predicted outer membrane repeat protein
VVEGGYAGTGNLDIDPKLGPLGNYGGSTQTLPLVSGSSAIDAGNDSACPAADQRGVARPQGAHCDIGAFESVPGEYILSITSVHGTVTKSPNQVIYHENDTVQLTAIPDVDWEFLNWSGDLAGSDNPASFVVHGDMFITAHYACPTPVITVTSDSDSGPGSLRQAIADICPGGTIAFDADRTITLASELLIDHDMTIDGQTHAVTVSGNHVTRVFNISSGNVAFDHLTIADGNVQTTDCGPWSGGANYYCGGGMILQGNLVTVTVSHSIFSNNQADTYGGGIANFGDALTITDSTFSGNNADYDGGGMYNYRSSLTLTNVTFSGNSATYQGGGMVNSSSNPVITNVTFSGNSAASSGGGMSNSVGNPALTNVTFSGNSAGWGGGMHNSDGNPTLTNTTFSGNSAGTYGGGIFNNSGSPVLTNVILWGDTGEEEIYNNSGATPTVTYSVVEGGYAGTGNLDIDPKLGPLGDYGGSTQFMPGMILPAPPLTSAAWPVRRARTATSAPSNRCRESTSYPSPPPMAR